MVNFFPALTSIVLPIFLVAAVGVVLGRTRTITDSRPLARLALYFFSPALVLTSIARSRLSPSDLFSILVYSFAVAALMGIIGYLLARLLNLERLLTSAFLLSILFVNAGNLGLPFNQFAYGQAGVSRAAVYFVGNSILAQTLAVFIASRGRQDVRQSVSAVFRMPLVYAVIVGLVLNRENWSLPEPVSRSLDLVAAAAVPLMLVILGLELARARIRDYNLTVVLATLLKLFVTPAVALVLAEVMRLQGLTRTVSILEASMPTAVLASIIAVQFDARSDFVTGVIFLSTLGSIVTLVVLLVLLGYTPA